VHDHSELQPLNQDSWASQLNDVMTMMHLCSSTSHN